MKGQSGAAEATNQSRNSQPQSVGWTRPTKYKKKLKQKEEKTVNAGCVSCEQEKGRNAKYQNKPRAGKAPRVLPVCMCVWVSVGAAASVCVCVCTVGNNLIFNSAETEAVVVGAFVVAVFVASDCEKQRLRQGHCEKLVRPLIKQRNVVRKSSTGNRYRLNFKREHQRKCMLYHIND